MFSGNISSLNQAFIPFFIDRVPQRSLSDCQFAHRLVPAYLDNTHIVGISSSASALHWISLLDVWINGEALFLPLKISKKDLIHLQAFLQSYLETLQRYETTGVDECEVAAQKSLEQIQRSFQKNRICYTPLGYAAGVRNHAHSIPLKLTKQGEVIEALFLNLGEGVEMHPFIDWSIGTERYHFQSFPVMIDHKTLFSERGIEAFTRLVLIQCVECPENVRPYSAQDVYGVIYALGTLRSSFRTPIENRNCKPQLGDICADMAVTLIIKDVLIDLGYTKEEIQRFFFLEKFCDILFFHQTLQAKEGDIDQWTLLKNGVHEFVIRGLKSSPNVISEKELEAIHQMLQGIVNKARVAIQNKLQKTTCLPFMPLSSAEAFLFKHPPTTNVTNVLFQKWHQPSSGPRVVPGINRPTPESVADELIAWSQEAHALRENEEFLKAIQFVCNAFATLPIPDPKKNDFWDLVPKEKIDVIILNLSRLTANSAYCDPFLWKTPFYPQLSILLTGYAIVDKLVRKKYSCLKGFASPFYPSRQTLRCFFYNQAELTGNQNSFDFLFLPLESFNSRWIAIRYYFETIQAASIRTLFALESNTIHLKKAVEDFRKVADFFKSESGPQQHLKFLESFLDRLDASLNLEEKFMTLWLNEGNRYIPQTLEILYCFAYHAWFCFKGRVTAMDPERVPRSIKDFESIVIREPKLNTLDLSSQTTLGTELKPLCQWIIEKPVAENSSQCIDLLPPQADRIWSLAHLRQWARIFSNQSLTITSVLQWMRQNVTLIAEKDFQQLIEIALFKPGRLVDKVKQEPSILAQLRLVIAISLKHFTTLSLHIDTVHFLVRLGISFETYDSSPCLTTLQKYESLLLQQKNTSYSHLVFLYQVGLPREKDSLCELIKACYWLNYHEPEKTTPWLEIETLSPLQKYSKELVAAAEDDNWKELTFKKVFELLLPDQPIPDEPCVGKYPYLSKGQYTLNLEGSTIKDGSAQLFYLNQAAQSVIDALGTNLVWNQGHVFYAPNHACKFEKNAHGRWAFFRKFPNHEAWFEKKEISSEVDIPIKDLKLFDFWCCQNTILVCRKNENSPLYLIDLGVPKDCHVYKLRAHDYPLRLVNLWKTNVRLMQWFERLGELTQTCVWTNNNGIIEEFEILDLNLRFHAEGSRFHCLTYPEFFLAEEQSLNALDHFEGAIVLENLKGKKCVLLLTHILQPYKGDFTTRVFYAETFLNEKFEKMFLYQLDPLEGILLHSQPEANLFLTLLFAMQRNYTKALYYLKQAQDFQYIFKTCNAMIDQFFGLKDHSPEALAFYLRFSLFLISNSKQLILEGYGQRLPLPSAFYQWTAEQFTNYLRVHSAKEVSRIPRYIRLNPAEELLILEEMKSVLTQGENPSILNLNFAEALLNSATEILKPKSHWQPLFDMRLSLLKTGKWTSTIGNRIYPLFSPDQLFTLMKDFSQINTHFPNYLYTDFHPLIRFTNRDLCNQFVHLYRKAREGKGEFDVFFLMRSSVEIGHPSQLRYALVLLYVQKNPHEFKELDFNNDPATDPKIFAAIIEKAGRKLAQIWQTASLVQTILGERRIQFNYQKTIQLSLNHQASLRHTPWQLKQEDIEKLIQLSQEVYHHFLNAHLDITQEPFFTNNSLFPFTQKPLSFTTQEILLRLKKGHAKLLDPKHGKTHYRLKEGKTVEDCLKDTIHLLDLCRQDLANIKSHAEALANSYPQTAYRLGLRHMGRDLPEITLDGILTQSYLVQNPSLICSANPSLSTAQIERLMNLTIQYHLTCIHIHQLERALSGLHQKGSIQQFGENLAVYPPFDFINEPEWLIYQSRTGKILRKEQARLLQWEKTTCDEPIRLFEAPAGSGKTTCYIPPNMPRVSRSGLLPFSVSPRPLYHVDRMGLKQNCQQIFGFEVHVLELTLSAEATAADCQRIYEQLVQHHTQQHGFKLTPAVYDAIDLKYRLCLDQKLVEEVRWLRRILAYFKNHVAILVDECRLNCSPFMQSKIGIGKPIPLPAIDRKVFLQIGRALINSHLNIPDGRTIPQMVLLQENFQATMSPSEFDAVKTTILKHLTQDLTWLRGEEETEQKRALEILHIFFEEFFESSMRLVWMMQYVHSIQKGEALYVPARTRQATRAYYEEIYLTLIATIHGTLQEGLGIDQAYQLFEELEKTHFSQTKDSDQVSIIEYSLRTWLNDPDFRLAHFSLNCSESINKFHARAHENPEILFWFLEHIALPQALSCPEQIIVNPMHFRHAFKQVTLFSTDPGPKEIYGIYTSGKHIRRDPQFMAHAIQQFLAPHNAQILTFPFFAQAQDFFNYLLGIDRKIFSHLRMICDAGGMLRNFTVNELVHAFFAFLNDHPEIPYNGLIMFEEASDKEEETKLFLWMKEVTKPYEMQGHDIPAAMSSLGYDWEKLHFLTFIDPSHRAGANIEQPKNSSILVLIGEDLTLSDDVQGKLRGRGVLQGDLRIIWGLSQKMAPLISDVLTPQAILEWEIDNESKRIDAESILSAFQQIDYWLEEPITKVLHAEDDPHKQITLWHKHRKGLVKVVDVDPLLRFKGGKSIDRTETVLWNYAKQNYANFQYTTPFEKAIALHEKFKPIITHAGKRQEYLSTSARVDSRRHSNIYTFQQEKMNKVCVTETRSQMTPEKVLSLPFGMSIDSNAFIPDLIASSRLARDVFGSQHLTPSLFFTHNALCTAKTGDLSLKEKYLKPVQYLLITKDKKGWTAFALSDREAAFFQRQLLIKTTPFQVVLISSDGALAQNGQGVSSFSLQMLQDPFVQDALIDVGLARCILLHPLRFVARIEHWHDFWPMWQKMKEWQTIQKLGGIFEIEKHVPLKIKNFTPQKQAPSFLRSLMDLLS